MAEDCVFSGLRFCRRRAMLGAATVMVPWVFPARAEDQANDPTAAPPQMGDHFVFLTGPNKDRPARVVDLELGGPQAQVYPADPKGLLRDGTPLNLVVLVRVGDEGLDEQTRKLSADGVVAYSAICTHQACPVNQWSTEKRAMVCSCHGSTYDPKNSAKVIFGPAPMPLAGLPLKNENGLLVVAGKFDGPIGRQTE
jgi:rieske iron-sulfur protein